MRMFLLLSSAALLAVSLAVWRLQPSADPKGRIVLTWVSDLNPLRKEQAQLYEKLHPDIKVNVDPDNGAIEKVIVQSLAGVGPDVYDAFGDFQLAAYVRSGVAKDVTGLLQRDGIDIQKQVYSGILGNCIYEGKTYGLPTNVANDAIWFHGDLLREAGVELPKGHWTWDKLIPLAQKLTKRRPDGKVEQYGFLFDNYMWQSFFTTYGAQVFTPDGRHCALDSSGAISAVQLMRDLVFRYHVTPSLIEQSSMATQGGFGSGSITWFGAKRGAMSLGGRWWLATLRGFKGLELRAVECPYGTVRQYNTYGRAMLVNPASRHLKEALELQRFMADPQYMALLNKQADSIAAFKKANYIPTFEHDPDHPNEVDNAVWREIADVGISSTTSPYVDTNIASKLVQTQIDLVMSGQKSPAQAMRDASKNVESAIQKALVDDPALSARYNAGAGR